MAAPVARLYALHQSAAPAVRIKRARASAANPSAHGGAIRANAQVLGAACHVVVAASAAWEVTTSTRGHHPSIQACRCCQRLSQDPTQRNCLGTSRRYKYKRKRVSQHECRETRHVTSRMTTSMIIYAE